MSNELQRACMSAIAGETRECQYLRQVALILAQVPRPHRLEWEIIKCRLSIEPVKPVAANLQACKFLEIEVFPKSPQTVKTVRLRVEALPQAPTPTGDALATKPAPSPSSSMAAIKAQLARACSTIADPDIAARIQRIAELLASIGPPHQLSWGDICRQIGNVTGLVKEVRPFRYFKVKTQPEDGYPLTVQLLMDKVVVDAGQARSGTQHAVASASAPAESFSSIMALIRVQLSQACSAISDRDMADIVRCIAVHLARAGPPHEMSWSALQKQLKFVHMKGLSQEVRSFKYFKIVKDTGSHEPRSVQLLMDKMIADAQQAGHPGAEHSTAFEAHPAPARAPPPIPPPPPPELPAPRPAIPASAPVASCDIKPRSAQGQVFQLSFNSSGQPIYTPRAPGLPSLPATEKDTDDADAAAILNLLPPSVKSACAGLGSSDMLVEVVQDVGRPPVLKFQGAKPVVLKDVGPVDLQEAVDCLVAALKLVSQNSTSGGANTRWLSGMDSDVDLIELSSGSEPSLQMEASTSQPATAPHRLFGPDNRLGIPGTLHRISAIRARDGSITGLTYRIGRHLPGMADILSDVMHKVAQTMDVPRINLDAIVSGGTNAEPRPSLSQPTSILVLGRPGLGKTTLLRDIARVLADEFELAVVVVDSSLEIGGAAAVPHPALGAARRMEVRDRFSQQDVLIEAVQNHAPQVVVIDEIGTAKEVEAVKTIAQRGVAMAATAHGTDLMSIISNPVLAPYLVASRPKPSELRLLLPWVGGVKTQLERTSPACFTCLVELLDADTYRVHHNLEESVDMLLVDVAMKRAATSPAALLKDWKGRKQAVVPHTEIRQRQAAGQPVLTVFETQEAAARAGLIA